LLWIWHGCREIPVSKLLILLIIGAIMSILSQWQARYTWLMLGSEVRRINLLRESFADQLWRQWSYQADASPPR
jgi:hypothetical protein